MKDDRGTARILAAERDAALKRASAIEAELDAAIERVSAIEAERDAAIAERDEARRQVSTITSLAVELRDERNALSARLDAVEERLDRRLDALESFFENDIVCEPHALDFMLTTSHKSWTRDQWMVLVRHSASKSDLTRIARLHERTVTRYLERYGIQNPSYGIQKQLALNFLDRPYTGWRTRNWTTLVTRTTGPNHASIVTRLPVRTIMRKLDEHGITPRWGTRVDQPRISVRGATQCINHSECVTDCCVSVEIDSDDQTLCSPNTEFCNDNGKCINTCPYASDGDCDDGGPSSDFSLCELGTDCADCGTRY